MVSAGIDIKRGTAAARHVNYLSCGQQGCTAATPMDDAFIKETAAAAKGDIVLYAANGRSLDFGIPTTGFDKAVAALKK